MTYTIAECTVSCQNKFVKLVQLQGGARNVIPLTVQVTHFYYYKSI